MTRAAFYRIISLLLVTAAGLAAAGCGAAPPSGAPAETHHHHEGEDEPLHLTPDAMQANGVRVEAARPQSLDAAVTYPGRVTFDTERMAHVSVPVSGRVAEVRARLGDSVARGDVLLVVDSVALGQAQSDYLQRRTQVQSAHTALEVSRTAAERAERLLAEKGISVGEYQRRDGDRRRAEADLQAAEAAERAAADQLRLWGMAPADVERLARSARIEPGYAVRAPIAGQVVERHATLGEVVGPEREAVFLLADTRTLWVLADVPESEIQHFRTGQAAAITAPALGGAAVRGTVTFIPPAVDPATRTVPLRIEVSGKGLPLKAGMFVEVRFTPAGGPASRLAVPADAVQSVDGRPAVFLELAGEPGAFRPRFIQPGPATGGLVPIAAGLQTGDRVVVAGAFVLKAQYEKALMEGKTCSGH
ncbi:MAG TPA: efflux RND transporter periplasmic adaptor subunit [Acidobacteriota bacterium]|nr:efflux RND transporter periplasmic adaptor subunit [Acidobacteriota bacterium]